MVPQTGIWASILLGLSPQPMTAAHQPAPIQAALRYGESEFSVTSHATGRDIDVFVYRAARHGPMSPVVIVIPGENRNAEGSRRAWIEAADRYGLMVIVPRFSKADFPDSADYNIAGMLREDPRRDERDESLPLTQQNDWLFRDIEAIFDAARLRNGVITPRYDLFGHSAGGQIVHRMVMFAPQARFNRAVAANAGWYTVPDMDAPFPYGLARLPFAAQQVDRAFDRRMTLLLGDEDDADERRGTLRKSKWAKQQGAGRIDRGRYFYDQARRMAAQHGKDLHWAMRIVRGVGHDHRAMSRAAADYLYAPRYASLDRL